MSSTILLVVLLSAHITGLISEQLLNAAVGGSVLIPCSVPGHPLTFFWQEGYNTTLFHWKDGKRIEEQNKYKNRSQIFPSEFRSGNISFRLHNISVEDDQKLFFTVYKSSDQHCRSRLQVSATYQHLDLTVNHTTSSATCRARGGYPAAQVSWKGLNRTTDDQLDLQDAETFLQQDPTEKTFSFTSSVNVTGFKSVTCVVYNPHSKKTVTREIGAEVVEITTDENGGLNVAAIVVPVLILAGVLVGVYLWYKKQRPGPAKPHARVQYQAQAQDPHPPNQPPVDPNARDPVQEEAPDPAQPQAQAQDQNQDQDQYQNQAEDADAAEPAQDPVQEEAGDAPEDAVSLTGTGAALRRRTRTSEGSQGSNTCEDAAASPERENLLENRSSVSENVAQN